MINIFIADDQAMFREGVKSIISNDNGLTVVCEAADGNETLRKLRDVKTDVLLLDVSMPAMGGLEVLKRLREFPATQAIPVIFLSAHPVFERDPDADNLGPTFYITKPWKRGAIERAIRNSVGGQSKK